MVCLWRLTAVKWRCACGRDGVSPGFAAPWLLVWLLDTGCFSAWHIRLAVKLNLAVGPSVNAGKVCQLTCNIIPARPHD